MTFHQNEYEVKYSLLKHAAGTSNCSDSDEPNGNLVSNHETSRIDMIGESPSGLTCHNRTCRLVGLVVAFCSGILLMCCVLIILASVGTLSLSPHRGTSPGNNIKEQAQEPSDSTTKASVSGSDAKRPPLPKFPKSSDPAELSDWEFELMDVGSECAVREYDINADGTLDILVGLTYVKSARTNESLHCQQFATSSGCKGGIVALDGRNGAQLWRIHTKDEIFELTCPALDVNKDGVTDCIASGRYGTLIAFDPRRGEMLWSMPSHLNSQWNVFGSGFIDDIDDDGVNDMVVVNGGDTAFSPGQTIRPGNTMLLVSSRTGDLIGSKVLPTPDDHESYCLPTVYTQYDGSRYIFFGTGGEHIPGGLHFISLKDMLTFVHPGHSYQLPGRYNHWRGQNYTRHSSGVVTLYQTQNKGVMVPVSFADLNNDGYDDIVAITFDAVLLAFSGLDLSPLWNPVNFSVDSVSTESYFSPSFAHFNDDQYLDLMVAWQTGSYPLYDSNMMYIIDGRSGEVLWFKDTPAEYSYAVTLPLALSTAQPYRDAFIYRMSSTNVPFSDTNPSESNKHGENSMQGVHKRHIGMHSQGKQSCDEMDTKFVDTLIMDRSNMRDPLVLYTQHATPYYFNITKQMIAESDSMVAYLVRKRRHGDHGHGDEEEEEETIESVLNTIKCSRFNPRDSSAALLTDLDRDGDLDYVSLDTSFTNPRILDKLKTSDVALKTIIRKFSLEKLMKQQLLSSVHLDEVVPTFISSEVVPLANMTLAKISSQRWRQYLGNNQDGVY